MYERGMKGESLASRGGISEPYFGCERVKAKECPEEDT